jgi:hypothetical protein
MVHVYVSHVQHQPETLLPDCNQNNSVSIRSQAHEHIFCLQNIHLYTHTHTHTHTFDRAQQQDDVKNQQKNKIRLYDPL